MFAGDFGFGEWGFTVRAKKQKPKFSSRLYFEFNRERSISFLHTISAPRASLRKRRLSWPSLEQPEYFRDPGCSCPQQHLPRIFICTYVAHIDVITSVNLRFFAARLLKGSLGQFANAVHIRVWITKLPTKIAAYVKFDPALPRNSDRLS